MLKGSREHLHIYMYGIFFLPLGFEHSNEGFIEYPNVTFGFDPCVLLPTGYCIRTGSILFGACSDFKK